LHARPAPIRNHECEGEPVTGAPQRPRLAVVSPFLDKQHGTERGVVEWIAQLAKDFEIHIYSQRVQDVDLSQVVWHRISTLPGPHILNFVWWFVANRVRRGFDRRFRGLGYDLVYSPGANCFDADVVSLHILFSEYVRETREQLRLAANPPWHWPRLLHRKLYYALAIFLERRVYGDPRKILTVMSRSAASALERISGRSGIFVLYIGLDLGIFNPQRRAALRQAAREQLELPPGQFALLLVGNDWRNKGVLVLLEALEKLRDLPLRLFVVSREVSRDCLKLVDQKALNDRIQFLPPRKDVEFYYAAADAYVGPSLQDMYAMPPAEAMACGVPAIVSAAAGVSEIITDGVDGLILADPRDADALAKMIRRLCEDESFRHRLAESAAQTAQRYTWPRYSRELAAIFEDVLRRKAKPAPQALEQKL
jgi:glycosyltransferase involved in cell wall biosynthesis